MFSVISAACFPLKLVRKSKHYALYKIALLIANQIFINCFISSCVRSAMLHGSETWCLRENEMVILRRTERAMVRSMCGVKLVDRKNTEELMKMLGLKETLDKMAKVNGVRWYGNVVSRDDESILKKVMMFEVNGPRKRGRPKQTWKKQVEENIKKIGLRVEEATDRARWREGVGAIAEGMRCIRPLSDTRKNQIKTGR